MGSERLVKSEQELLEVEKAIRDSGYYPFRITPEELAKLESDKNNVDAFFTKVMVENVERWIRTAEEALKEKKIKCFISPGNDDRWAIDQPLNSSDYIVNPEMKVVNVDANHEMITMGLTNHTPWHSPREFDEECLAEKLDSLISQLDNKQNAIFNIHCPPIGTGIDSAPKLDETLKPVSMAGQTVMISAGSTATRDAILKHQPLVGLHGHIHESRGVVTLAKTKCFNPGSEYGSGVLRGLILNLGEKKINSYLFTSG
jgi:Icc-related predicted phosphoesterase